MKKTALIALMSVAATLPALAQNKIDNRLGDSAEVLKQILLKPDEIPRAYLNKAVCVLVFPSVKKVAVGIGGSYGRGTIVCRTGTNMTGPWSPPAMYKIDVGSLGVQLGTSATDYVMLVQNKTAAQKILSGKLKLGAGCSAVAGPSGAQAQALNDPNVDVLTYSRAKGLFAGASMAGASLDTDDDANKTVYNKDITATTIVREGGVTTTTAGQPLIMVLTKYSPKYIN
jgi:SH3 domain-containing YSC84-like protein 1